MKNRGGFGMIYALIIIILIATLLAFSLRFSASTVNTTFDEHARIQLRLFERSVMEMAILELQKDANFRTREYTLNDHYNFIVVATPLNAPRVFLLDIHGYVTPPQDGIDRRISISSRKIVKP